jgi:hypothetical protein
VISSTLNSKSSKADWHNQNEVLLLRQMRAREIRVKKTKNCHSYVIIHPCAIATDHPISGTHCNVTNVINWEKFPVDQFRGFRYPGGVWLGSLENSVTALNTVACTIALSYDLSCIYTQSHNAGQA